jgi:ring-1,2-phenylacetyl-CoA epoxidase subunit PaaD
MPNRTPTDIVHAALEAVKDPEIPTVSVIELGIIEAIVVSGSRARVTMIPTYSGCPALDVMRADIAKVLRDIGFEPEVIVSRQPWSTDRLSDSARAKLKALGIAPPRPHGGNVEWELHSPLPCPYCGSTETEQESQFGPTLCRSIFFCRSCRQSFERFKPL